MTDAVLLSVLKSSDQRRLLYFRTVKHQTWLKKFIIGHIKLLGAIHLCEKSRCSQKDRSAGISDMRHGYLIAKIQRPDIPEKRSILSEMSQSRKEHDAFVRKIFSDKEIATDYFKAVLPPSVSRNLDFETLKREPDTYLTEELKRSMSDIVYSCTRKDGRGSVKTCLLIEHKSHLYQYSPVQLGRYIFSGLERQIESGEPLALIIPILFYHGKQRWRYQTLRDLFENMGEELKVYLPDFEYIFYDLGELDDEEIKRLNNKFLAASFLALKYAFSKDLLEQKALDILLLSHESKEGLQRSLIIYLFTRSELKSDMLDSLPENLKSNVMNTLEIYVEKGIEIGLEKAEKLRLEKLRLMIENIIKNTDWDDQQIADITNESVEFVGEVRASMKK